MRNCVVCRREIPPARLKVLPDTETCVGCSQEEKTLGVMEYAHKTGGVLVPLPKDPEQRRLAIRQNRRSR